MGYRGSVSFVVAPNHKAEDLEIKVVDADRDAVCGACGHTLDPYEEARKRGQEFMQMVFAVAHGGFWDGMRDFLRQSGYLKD